MFLNDIANALTASEVKKKAAQSRNSPVKESISGLRPGSDVVITGPVEFEGATGVLDSFSPSGEFVVVNLYNHGKKSFQRSDVSYNDYADSDQEEADMYDRDEDFRRSQSHDVDEDSWTDGQNAWSSDKNLWSEGVEESALTANTPDPVVVVQDRKGTILDTVNLSVAVQKYRLGNAQSIKNQLAHQNYTTIGNYVVAAPMGGQPQDKTTSGVTENDDEDDHGYMPTNLKLGAYRDDMFGKIEKTFGPKGKQRKAGVGRAMDRMMKPSKVDEVTGDLPFDTMLSKIVAGGNLQTLAAKIVAKIKKFPQHVENDGYERDMPRYPDGHFYGADVLNDTFGEVMQQWKKMGPDNFSDEYGEESLFDVLDGSADYTRYWDGILKLRNRLQSMPGALEQLGKMVWHGLFSGSVEQGITDIGKKGVAEDLEEDVGGNYLYHSTNSLKSILASGQINKSDFQKQQDTTRAQTKLPTFSVTRDWNYAVGGKGTGQVLGAIGRSAIIVLDRNAVESNFKTLSTGQSGDKLDFRGTPYPGNTGFGYNVIKKQPDDAYARRQIAMRKKMATPDNTKGPKEKMGGEFEEAVVVPKGSMPIKGTMVGFYIPPSSPLMKDPEIVNDPRRLDLAKGGTGRFVKAAQQPVQQAVAEAERNEMDAPEFQDKLARLNQNAKKADQLKAKGLKPQVRRDKHGRYYVDFDDPSGQTVKESYWDKLQAQRNTRINSLVSQLEESIKDIK
jgi:hypothetical protein